MARQNQAPATPSTLLFGRSAAQFPAGRIYTSGATNPPAGLRDSTSSGHSGISTDHGNSMSFDQDLASLGSIMVLSALSTQSDFSGHSTPSASSVKSDSDSSYVSDDETTTAVLYEWMDQLASNDDEESNASQCASDDESTTAGLYNWMDGLSNIDHEYSEDEGYEPDDEGEDDSTEGTYPLQHLPTVANSSACHRSSLAEVANPVHSSLSAIHSSPSSEVSVQSTVANPIVNSNNLSELVRDSSSRNLVEQTASAEVDWTIPEIRERLAKLIRLSGYGPRRRRF